MLPLTAKRLRRTVISCAWGLLAAQAQAEASAGPASDSTVKDASPQGERALPCGNFFGQRCRLALGTGIRMSYFEVGPAGGEALIFLHTDTTSAVDWAWTVPVLARLNPGLRLIALDQRGAGLTDLPDTEQCWQRPNLCITRTALAADLLAFMDAKGIRRATLVGHAMGASIARRVALSAPERVDRLILSGTGVWPTRPVEVPVPGAPPRPPPYGEMELLGWQKMAEGRGVRWPEGALHLRPLDIDADAARNIARNWDISAVADPEIVLAIAAQTAQQPLSVWERLDPTPMPAERVDPWERLSVPLLAFWGSEDAGLDHASQERLIAKLREAVRNHPGMSFYWKQYGVRPPPASGDKHDADDIGHNICWEAPAQLAADIDSYVRTGAPTRDRVHTDAPRDIHRIVVEPGQANVVSSAMR